MRYLFLVFSCFIPICLHSQSLWFLPTTHPSYLSTFHLLKNLHIAAGDSGHIPHLEIEKKGMNPPQTAPVAYYNAFFEEIVIEEEILELCHNFGKDSVAALAFVLGHELAHHNLGHTSSKFCPFHLEIAEAQDSSLLKNEIAADNMGNFYARLAGYSPCDLGEKLIYQIYHDFSIQSNLNYPSLNNRIQLLQHNCQSGDTLAHLFYVAQKLSENKEYEASLTLFHHLLAHFPNKEMYLNAAIPCLQWVVNEGFDSSDSIYQMPFLFESTIHFRQSMSPNVMRLHIKKRTMFLKEAKQYVELALQIDKNYTLAKLYLAYIIYLEGKVTGNLVEDIITDKLKQTPYFSDYEQNIYHLLWGIQFAIERKRVESEQSFAAIQTKWECVNYNRCLLNKKALPITINQQINKNNAPIEWQNAKKIQLFLQGEMLIEAILSENHNIYHFKDKTKDWYF